VTVADEPAPAPAPAPPADVRPADAPTVEAPTVEAQPARRLGYVPELNGVRALAVLIVVIHHLGAVMWPGRPGWFFPGGQVGLDLFFALSGFLITALLLGEHGRTGGIRVGNFLWRRLLRLLPALVVLMAGLFVASTVTGRYTPREMLGSAAWVLTFSTNIGVHDVIVEVGHTWSLSVEAHFYVGWGLVTALVVAVAKRPYPVLAGLAVAGILASATLRALVFVEDGGVTAFRLYVGSLYRMDAPLIGALVAIAWVAGWLDRVPARAAAWASALSLVALGVAVVRTTGLSPILYHGLFTAIAGAAAVLVVSVQLSGPSTTQRLLSARPMVLLGAVSYSVYLWHLPVMMYLNRNAEAWPLGPRLLVALVASVVIGALSYQFVERPFLRRKARASA
jgi:peptidoglycan/LPS O-acetylase OafA/YrhL